MTGKVSRNQGANEAIEPHRIDVPKMDRPSVALAWFLDSMVVEWAEHCDGPVLVCHLCSDEVCEIESDDTLRVLLNTALAHTCGGE